jgi:hypothetical protein
MSKVMKEKYYIAAALLTCLPQSSCAMWRSSSFLKQYNQILNKIERLRKDLAKTSERGNKQRQQIEKLWNLYDRRSILEETLEKIQRSPRQT